MGMGIAQVVASHAKRPVVLVDVDTAALDQAKQKIGASLSKLEEKGKIAGGEARAALERIHFARGMKELRDCGFLIEAIIEKASVKTEIFAELDRLARPESIFASNTSSIPISTLSRATGRPGQFIGMHFMNPVPLMSLVEIVRSPLTSDATFEQTRLLAQAMGKQTVVSKDFPGFIVNRLLMPMINEAFFALHEGLATPEDIDLAMKLGTNQPMGPLALADFIGLDTCLFILEVLHHEFGDPKFRPSPLLRQLVNAGLLGRKSGRGVYRYES
jgi:3-hydroxybutyryl-CoA dehydrogenase